MVGRQVGEGGCIGGVGGIGGDVVVGVRLLVGGVGVRGGVVAGQGRGGDGGGELQALEMGLVALLLLPLAGWKLAIMERVFRTYTLIMCFLFA